MAEVYSTQHSSGTLVSNTGKLTTMIKLKYCLKEKGKPIELPVNEWSQI